MGGLQISMVWAIERDGHLWTSSFFHCHPSFRFSAFYLLTLNIHTICHVLNLSLYRMVSIHLRVDRVVPGQVGLIAIMQ